MKKVEWDNDALNDFYKLQYKQYQIQTWKTWDHDWGYRIYKIRNTDAVLISIYNVYI